MLELHKPGLSELTAEMTDKQEQTAPCPDWLNVGGPHLSSIYSSGAETFSLFMKW